MSEGAIVVNLAAEHRDDVRQESLYDEVNVVGVENICAAANKNHVKTIIFTSSVAVYGFALLGTDETGKISPFNAYGRTKYEAELVYRTWQEEKPHDRTLVIVRPTVVFGEGNRGNVYNLLKHVASGWFVMVGNGKNKKSMAYVENVAAYLEHTLFFRPGIHVYNYVDKPDFTMNDLVATFQQTLGKPRKILFRLPYGLGYVCGVGFDALAAIFGRSFAVSLMRIKKFCSNSVFNAAVAQTGFVAPVPLAEALKRTVKYEFPDSRDGKDVLLESD